MKLSQLMLAGDYITYKGDWATNTAYNVNDVVTWNKDGHLYEVIKAHTSSDSLNPSQTEYYKAMTKTKAQKSSYNLFSTADIKTLKDRIKAAQEKGIQCFGYINWENNITPSPLLVSDNGSTLSSYLAEIKSDKSALVEYFLVSYASNTAILYKRTTIFATGEITYTELSTKSIYCVATIGY